MAKQTEISQRAERAWQRLKEWYGVRLAESYGATIPSDWARIIDHTDNDSVKRGLSLIRSRHVEFPPTLPQFEAAMRPATGEESHGPSPADRLCAFAMRTYGARMSAKQIRGPWTYFGTQGGEISGVNVPPDGDRPGYRITLADMEIPDFRQQPELTA